MDTERIRSNEEQERIIAERDKIVPSPADRAKFLWEHLQTLEPKPTYWDIICLAAESVASMASTNEWLRDVAKALIKRVYTAHYHTDPPIASCLPSSSVQPKQEISEPASSELTDDKLLDIVSPAPSSEELSKDSNPKLRVI